MANKFRGEVDFEVGDRKFTLCCTLQALAEMQTEMGVGGLAGVFEKMRKVSAPDILVMLKALIRGGGHEISDEEFAALPLEPTTAMDAVGEAFLGAKLLPKVESAGVPEGSDDTIPNANEPTGAAEAVPQPDGGEVAPSETEGATDQAAAKN